MRTFIQVYICQTHIWSHKCRKTHTCTPVLFKMAFDPCVSEGQNSLESFTFVNRVSQQISQKKLKKFEKEYHTLREQQEQQEAPIERYEVAQQHV